MPPYINISVFLHMKKVLESDVQFLVFMLWMNALYSLAWTQDTGYLIPELASFISISACAICVFLSVRHNSGSLFEVVFEHHMYLNTVVEHNLCKQNFMGMVRSCTDMCQDLRWSFQSSGGSRLGCEPLVACAMAWPTVAHACNCTGRRSSPTEVCCLPDWTMNNSSDIYVVMLPNDCLASV